MQTQDAILSFSQSEKIKSGIIWISHLLELSGGLTGHERQGGEKVILMLINMVIQEIQLARNVTGERHWDAARKAMDQAIAMINSGVGPESIVHLTQALSQVTSIGQRSMGFLRERQLI